jgi:hypothetical protein
MWSFFRVPPQNPVRIFSPSYVPHARQLKPNARKLSGVQLVLFFGLQFIPLVFLNLATRSDITTIFCNILRLE